MTRACAIVFLLFFSVCLTRGANILAVIPTVSKSHYAVFEPLVLELVKRGHSVVSITTFPQRSKVENLTELDVRETKTVNLNDFPFHTLTRVPESFLNLKPLFLKSIADSEEVLMSPEVSRLISSNASFDLIIYETFKEDSYLGFGHRFKAPILTVSSCFMYPWVADRFVIPASPAHVPGFYSGFSTNMGFYQRVENTFLDIVGKLFFKFVLEPRLNDVLVRNFGNDTPPIDQLTRNISVYLTSAPFTLFGAQSLPPHVFDIGGIHLKPAKPLPKELDKWMNESSEGVIYFSFGSMLRGATLPSEKVQAFLHVFQSLPQRVLWKWEDDTVDNLPNNVKIMKWIPQRDVLAHPKVKVFISHGGLLGTTEAVVSGVPILGIPMYGDQPNNVAALVENGVAVHVDYNNISVASLSYALRALLYDKSYRDNAKLLSHRFLDRPMSPLDTAVYWTEYVIRHRGAPHLQSAAVHLTWYEYYLLDVIAILIAAVVATLWIVYYVISSCLKLVRPSKSAKLKSN